MLEDAVKLLEDIRTQYKDELERTPILIDINDLLETYYKEQMKVQLDIEENKC